MKTKVDHEITQFIELLAETDEIGQNVQELLDKVREQYHLDVVYLLEKISSDNMFTYKYASVSKPEYDIRGVHMKLSEEDCEAAIHMYDDSPVCDYNVNSVKNYEISDCIIHYGFVRKRLKSYDGSIGFQCFTPHTWTEEEKFVLMKLGRIFKMMFSVSIAEGLNEHLYEMLKQERKQYRSALLKGTEYSFSFDITEGIIREKIVTIHGKDLIASLGLSLPAEYDKINEMFLKENRVQLLDESMQFCFTCEGLIQQYEKGITNLELEYYCPPADTYTRSVIVMYRDGENGHIHGLFMASDITKAKKKQEEQKRALQDAYMAASQANSAKSSFLANMSHDIRTPLNGIIGMTAIAGAHIDDRERVAGCLSKITVASKHLLGLINDVLDMSKIESGKIDLQDEEFYISEMLDELLLISKPQIQAKQHEFNVLVENVQHERVVGDSQRIQQALLNLLGNSIKYTPEGGKIELTIKERPYHRKGIGYYEIVIEDNGIGMSKEFADHIFDPFTRAEDERVNKIQGTGLGMAIAGNIINMMNGAIKVESEPEQGTRFFVTFFLKLQEEDESISSEKFVDLPILVVDDDETACESTCFVLEELGMKGDYVLCGEDAVERVVTRHNADDDYFAVIIDWKMPGMDGIATTKEIRKQVGDDVPIIIISAYDYSDIEVSARVAGANAFLSKPLFKSRISYLFQEILSGETNIVNKTALQEVKEEDFSGKRALLVEDNELNAEIAGEILGMTGLGIEYAKDGKEAVDKVSQNDDGYYDIIFMDIQMPVMNGYEATRVIRGMPREYAKTLPIVAMTANAFMEDVQACKEAGMNEHISKPLEFSKLIATLKTWLSENGQN